MKFDKELVKQVMVDHLKTVGYPNCPDEVILRQVPALFKILNEKNLMPPNMNWQIFRHIALLKYNQAKRRKHL